MPNLVRRKAKFERNGRAADALKLKKTIPRFVFFLPAFWRKCTRAPFAPFLPFLLPLTLTPAGGVVVFYFLLLLLFRVSDARIYGKNISVNQANVQFINKNRVECVQRRNLIHTPRPNHYFFLSFGYCLFYLLLLLLVLLQV